MPDISKINAVAIADIEKVDGILAADIEKVNGLVFSTAPAFVGLLDETYGSGAAAAYSVRRLASSATNLMRIREDATDTETDIGYDSNGDLLTADIATHCGTANGFVVTWYDQSGNGNDAEQPTAGGAALQPKIYDGTTQAVLTENGKAALDFDGTDDVLETTHSPTTSHTTFAVTVPTTGVSGQIYTSSTVLSSSRFVLFSTSTNELRLYRGGAFSASEGSTLSGQYLAYLLNQSTVSDCRLGVDGSNVAASGSIGNGTPVNISLGGEPGFNFYGNLSMQELVIYDGNNSSNKAAIEGNVNAHYQIGNFGTPTSGLLATYTGAAAAYSVRQLANTAPLSMRVRRDTAGGTGDDDEADVLFDFTLTDPTISLDSRINNASTGVASTTLGEFLNATGYTDVDSLGTVADGFCDTWYDQSGAGNDAEQTAFGSQPQIFDSASPTDLIKENGKPALDFDGTNDGLNCSTNLRTSTGASTVIQVRNVPPITGSQTIQNPFAFYKVQRQLIDGDAFAFYNEIAITTNETANEMIKFVNADLSGQLLHFATWDGSTQTGGVDEIVLYEDGTQETGTVSTITTGVTPSGTNCIGFRNDISSQFCDGTFQEVIVYLNDQSSNRSGIETDINTYFSIYT